MKQKFANEPLDFEYKPVKRSFQLVFSIESILFFVLIACMYMAYAQYFTGIIPGVSEADAIGLAWVIHALLYTWQMLSVAIKLNRPNTGNDLKIIHTILVLILAVLMMVLTSVLTSFLNFGRGFVFLLATFLVIIQHGLTWFYIINCFVRRKAENEPLDFEHKPVKQPFELVFSIEGILFFMSVACMYYVYSLTGIIPGDNGALIVAIMINTGLHLWQMTSSPLQSDQGWKSIHAKRAFTLFILFVWVMAIMEFLLVGNKFLSLVITFLIIIQQGLTWFYMINCFVQRKAENEPEISK